MLELIWLFTSCEPRRESRTSGTKRVFVVRALFFSCLDPCMRLVASRLRAVSHELYSGGRGAKVCCIYIMNVQLIRYRTRLRRSCCTQVSCFTNRSPQTAFISSLKTPRKHLVICRKGDYFQLCGHVYGYELYLDDFLFPPLPRRRWSAGGKPVG